MVADRSRVIACSPMPDILIVMTLCIKFPRCNWRWNYNVELSISRNDNSYRKLPFGTNKTFLKQATPRMCWDLLGPPSRALVDLPQQQQQQQQQQQHGVMVAGSTWRHVNLPSKRRMRPRSGQADGSPTVFSRVGGASPAVAYLLLLLTGDVEINPGPSCYACGKNCRQSDTPLNCHAQDCGVRSHKQTRCSGVPRSQRSLPW